MSIILIVITTLFCIYGLLFLFVLIGWSKIFVEKRKENTTFLHFSVLIPFRNEETNCKQLVESLKSINYPKENLEFIFINDHSEDNSVSCFEKVLKNSGLDYQIKHLDKEEGKKKAIILGVNSAKNNYIITTDADCVHPKNWIHSINASFTENVDFVIGPVANSIFSFFSGLQAIEALQLVGITIGTAKMKQPMLCTGANLAYKKDTFLQVEPYHDNLNIMSGDDLFFLDKIQSDASYTYVANTSKDALVLTQPVTSVAELINRSIRWGGKIGYLSNKLIAFFGGIVLITNYSFLLLIFMSYFDFENINIFLKLCALKIAVDLILFFVVSIYYKQVKSIVYLPVMVLYYPVVLVVISISAMVKKPKWKNR